MADRDYEVGYGKPPVHSRFTKGKSGFAGRRHASKRSATEELDAILAETIAVSDGGKSVKMTRQQVFLRQLVTRAIGGDRHAGRLIMTHLSRGEAAAVEQGDTSADDFLLAELARMMAGSEEGPSDGTD